MAVSSSGSDLATAALPHWDLSDLYSGPDSPDLRQDLAACAEAAARFRDSYQGKVLQLPGDRLGRAIAEYEALHMRLGRIGSYAGLYHAEDMNDPKRGQLFQNAHERITAITADLLFFTLDLNRIDETDLEQRLAAPELDHYRPWLRDLRVFRPHQLSDELERLLHEKSVTGHTAWSRLFDETLARLRFPVRGYPLTNAAALNLLSDPDRALRQDAASSIAAVLKESLPIFTTIMNTIVKDKEIDDRWRGYGRPISYRNLSNYVEDEVVDALLAAVKGAYPQTAHRYYRLKARWLGLDRLEYWDRNAPLPEQEDRQIPWQEARDTVLDSYKRFSPRLAELGSRFFDRPWIDAPATPGKSPGAFAHPTVPTVHPYILLNYMGRTRDVMTLAHELGHGVHQLLAAPRGYLMADTPLTLAETASVFGEMLTFQSMLARETEPARRKALLAGKVEDMINTVVRQTAFAEFERRVHDDRRSGEVTADRIGEIWLAVQSESLGDGIRFAPGYETYWSYIPHFIHTPFYVYAYAFGDCLVNSLYMTYQGAEGGFAERYLDMLSAGGTRRHRELLAPFGLDATDPVFWDRGLGLLRGFIDELEALG